MGLILSKFKGSMKLAISRINLANNVDELINFSKLTAEFKLMSKRALRISPITQGRIVYAVCCIDDIAIDYFKETIYSRTHGNI